MKPVLKISELANLHDARYCAAVGIFLQAFSLEKGHPKKVDIEVLKEIKPWLAGPLVIGEYGLESLDEIRADLGVVDLDYVSLPMDYPSDMAKELAVKLVFRSVSELKLGSEAMALVLEIAGLFPEAILELSLPDPDLDIWEILASANLIERCLFKFPQADPIWVLMKKGGLQPFGFSLGTYVQEADGFLDYEQCDEIVDRYADLSEA